MHTTPHIHIAGPRWRILIEGDHRAFDNAPWVRKHLDYLVCRLFAGGEVAESALAHHGITVRHLGDNVEIWEVSGD